MAAARKKRVFTQVSESSAPEAPYQLVGEAREVFTPSTSPARELQAELIHRLKNERSPRRRIAADMIAGTFAASCIIGLTFIAIV